MNSFLSSILSGGKITMENFMVTIKQKKTRAGLNTDLLWVFSFQNGRWEHEVVVNSFLNYFFWCCVQTKRNEIKNCAPRQYPAVFAFQPHHFHPCLITYMSTVQPYSLLKSYAVFVLASIAVSMEILAVTRLVFWILLWLSFFPKIHPTV